MAEHRLLGTSQAHAPWRQVFANDAAREGDATVYVTEELYAVALQLDTMATYVLTDIDPTTWTQITEAPT